MTQTPSPAAMGWTVLVEERDRLRAILDMIAESVMVSVVTVPDLTPSKDLTVRFIQTITWGCGICNGESRHSDDPATKRGVYAHEEWCPRKTT